MTTPEVRAAPSMRVLSVNVGMPAELHPRDRASLSGIVKHPVRGRVRVQGVNLAGDAQADLSVHGGADKAVYAYAWEDYVHWRDAGGIAAMPGLFGENLTVTGIDLRDALVGERWRIGTTLLEVAQPRLPCFKLGMRLDDAEFPRRFLAMGRTGAYLRIAAEGDVGEGDMLEIETRPSHDVTLAVMVAALHDVSAAARLRVVPDLPTFWRKVADRAPKSRRSSG